jgi:AcrR family transcriptional regulator
LFEKVRIMETLSKRNKEKQAHEKEILAAAERIFCLKGYEDASMDEIAKEAQFTKRTVYQYFENKDELYFAVVLKGFKKLFARITEANKKEKSGYDKLERSCRSYYQFYRENPDIIRLINYLGNVRQKTSAGGRYKNELTEFNNIMLREIGDVIEEGKADGSIQFGLDTDKTALCLSFFITGFYNQLSINAGSYTDFSPSDQEDACYYPIELVIKPLKRSRAITATRKGTA